MDEILIVKTAFKRLFFLLSYVTQEAKLCNDPMLFNVENQCHIQELCSTEVVSN